jgi:trans-aconitate methyltransferase
MSVYESQHVEQPEPWVPPWDGASYAANTAHHRRYDAELLATLPLRRADRVLDLGCGSGDFTQQLAERVPDGHVVGLDAQRTMLDEARRVALANQSFIEGPVQRLAALIDDQDRFDVVCSRSVLHWVPWTDHPGVLADCLGALAPGGVLRIECGGGDNVREVAAFLDDVAAPFGPARAPWTFAGAGAYLDLVLAAGFRVDGGWVRTVAQRRSFTRDELLGWLHSQVLNAYEAALPASTHAAFRAAADERIDELRRADGTYDLTFVRLDVLAHRPT